MKNTLSQVFLERLAFDCSQGCWTLLRMSVTKVRDLQLCRHSQSRPVASL